jgi:heat shock protein HslJ
MKKSSFLIVLVFLFFAACSTHKKTTAEKAKEQTAYVKDSIEFYETDYEVRQKNYLNLMLGSWTVKTMKRQAMIEEEPLTNVSLNFTADSSFTGNGGCNRLSGRYTLKGTSIKFSRIITTKMACANIEQESAFLKLLEETVSAYSVSKNELLLRDGSSNIIFKAVR